MKFNGLSLPDSLIRDTENYQEIVVIVRNLYKKVVDGYTLNADDVKMLKRLEDDSSVIIRNHTDRLDFEKKQPENGNSYAQEPAYLEFIYLARTVRQYVRKTMWDSKLTLTEAKEFLNE